MARSRDDFPRTDFLKPCTPSRLFKERDGLAELVKMYPALPERFRIQ